ncbi:MAG: thiamine pyrophosphate-dependent dehydrogenase E1 component subunit alpha [Candidatus Helarchaeota archaeon]|nr:thiamine pyrophosphate-dependent dehydrogenase E1 component subunit alpha [Candidatus Helarchaeota archaeon]
MSEKIDLELALSMYKMMVKIRIFEENVRKLARRVKINGFVHTYAGEEAVAVGACLNLRKDDFITSTHRGHGHIIAKGGDIKSMMAELFGKETGICRGIGGSMHIADTALGILGANGIVGGGLPISVGAGLSATYRKTDQVTICFFGDGASNQGTFHESLNLAAVWKLPVVFICENNLYAFFTAQKDHQTIKDIAVRAKAYGIPSEVVDGMDVIQVYQAVNRAVQRARKGEGPMLVECKTYRYSGQTDIPPDPELYRTKDEVKEWRKKDPIQRLKNEMIKDNKITEEELSAIDEAFKKEIKEAIDFAKKSPFPKPSSALEGLFVE